MRMSSACAPDAQSDVIARKIVRESIAYTMLLREPEAAGGAGRVENGMERVVDASGLTRDPMVMAVMV